MGADPAQGFGRNAQKGGDMVERHAADQFRLGFQKTIVALLGRFKLDGIHAVLREDQGEGHHFPKQGFHLVVFGGESGQVIVVNAHDLRWFQGLDLQAAGTAFKKTDDGKAEALVHGDPFGDLLFIFVVEDPEDAFFYKKDMIGHGVFPDQKMITGMRPALPGLKKGFGHRW